MSNTSILIETFHKQSKEFDILMYVPDDIIIHPYFENIGYNKDNKRREITISQLKELYSKNEESDRSDVKNIILALKQIFNSDLSDEFSLYYSQIND